MDGHKMQWRNNLRIDEFFQVHPEACVVFKLFEFDLSNIFFITVFSFFYITNQR